MAKARKGSAHKRRASKRHGAPLDINARYDIPEALQYLKISRALAYTRIKAGVLKATKDGGRTFLHGSEIDRYLRLPVIAIEEVAA